MAKLGFTHTAGDVEPDDGFDLLEDGWYEVEIVESEMRDTKSGTGQYLNMQLKLTEGNDRYVGRVLFDRLNLDNPNETAVKIAKRTLDSIVRAVGLSQVDDSTELHGRPMLAKVKTRPARGEHEASNEIKAYRAVADGKPAPKGGGGWK